MAKKPGAPAWPAAEEETNEETTFPLPVAADWSARVIQNGVVTAADLPKIADAFLKYVFPDESVKKTDSQSMKKEITGYNAQYVINALNEIVGPGNWREYGHGETKLPGKAYVTIYYGTFEIGNWTTGIRKTKTRLPDGTEIETEEPFDRFQVLAQFSHVGGSRNMDEWESMKGARTNFLKKVCSYIGNGWRSYALAIDEDLKSLGYEEDGVHQKGYGTARTHAQTQQAKAPPPQEDAAPMPMTKAQKEQIFRIVGQLVDDPEDVPEKIKVIEVMAKKDLADFNVQNADEILRVLKKKLADKEAA